MSSFREAVQDVGRPARVLDFDVECRPLSWYAGDFNSKEITAIAWAWIDPKRPKKPLDGVVECRLLTGSKESWDWRPLIKKGKTLPITGSIDDMVEAFLAAYNEADLVTGHFIRGFDLPLLNGAAIELGLPPLGPKMTQDTKIDLIRFSGHSKSQENLGAMLGLRHPKVGMSQADWREANRLTPHGLKLVHDRVTGDVLQHIEMRSVLLDRHMLNPPKAWRGNNSVEKYHP